MSFLMRMNRARALVTSRTARSLHLREIPTEAPRTPMIKIIPEEKEGWEEIYWYGMTFTFVWLGIGLYFRPETSLSVWAREEAIATGWQTAQEALADLHKHRTKHGGEEVKEAFKFIEPAPSSDSHH